MVIRFLKRAGIYNVLEVAGFNKPHEEKIARDYVRAGIAEEVVRDEESGRWVSVEPSMPTTDETVDLASLSRDELVAMAEDLELEVTRADGKDGKPTMEDYIRALSEAAAATDDSDEGEDVDEDVDE